jgi:hypothetical protein
MKSFVSTLVIAFLSSCLLHGQTRAPIKITVDKDQKTHLEIRRQGQAQQSGSVIVHTPQVTERSREMVMNITLQNLGGGTMTGLVVKYTLFGKDKTTRAVRPAANGESTISLKPLETKTIKTEAVEFESQDIAFTHGHGAELNRSAGRDYYGIAVNVFLGEDKVASFFNPPSVAKELEKSEQSAEEKPVP